VSRWNAVYKQLKNRRVIRTGVVYLAFFWGAVEVADLLAGANMISENRVRWLLLGGLLGFPAVLTLSWFFESPWRERRWFSILGDVSVILAIGVATLLLARDRLFTSFTRPVVAIIRLEPTDTRPETADLAIHLAGRFRMLLATRAEIRVIELASSQSGLLSDLPIPAKASALGADLLIGGTVNQGDGEVRLNMQLFAADGALLWSDRFNDRLVDQAQLQNRVLNEIWQFLPLSGQALKALRELVVQCKYPVGADAIRGIVSADGSGRSESAEQLRVLSALIDQNRDNGLLHLARARAYFDSMEAAPPTSRPILQNIAMRDLDQAAIECPGHPEIESLGLYKTLQLQGREDARSRFLVRYPNESYLRSQLSAAYQKSGDIEAAIHLAAEAWILNPLDVETRCYYRQLLQSQGEEYAAESLQRMAVSMNTIAFAECPADDQTNDVLNGNME
jgi:TolB-like protein